jgi:hypothetical protein
VLGARFPGVQLFFFKFTIWFFLIF